MVALLQKILFIRASLQSRSLLVGIVQLGWLFSQTSHRRPVMPVGHEHEKPFTRSMHVPDLHGFIGLQSSISCEHCFPVYPAKQ